MKMLAHRLTCRRCGHSVDRPVPEPPASWKLSRSEWEVRETGRVRRNARCHRCPARTEIGIECLWEAPRWPR